METILNIPEGFNVVEQDDEALINPGHTVNNSSWKEWDLRWLRSLHINAENQSIISIGLPKFLDLGTGSGRYHYDEEDILKQAGKNLIATLKIDGSLLIRYVQDGQVKFRTRGSLSLGVDNAYEVDVFKKQFPLLVNAQFHPNDSLLFEWVTPTNQIVIRYPEPKLYLIGGVTYDRNLPWYEANPQLMTLAKLSNISKELGIELVHHYQLNKEQEITSLILDLKTNQEIEGFVLRFNGEQELVRVKALHYKILHALKSNLTSSKLVESWQSWGCPEYKKFEELFIEAYDYQTYVWATPAISSMFDGIREYHQIHDHVARFVEANRHVDRKTFALAAQERFTLLRLSMCFMMLDGKPVDDKMVQKLILQNSKQYDMRFFRRADDEIDTDS